MIVLRGGRVCDPATGLDAPADVLIDGDAIAAVGGEGAECPDDAEVVDVRGLIVGPGFIDLHSHVHSVAGHWLQALDGVTTALDLEAGLMPIGRAYADAAAAGRPLNYGFSASWALARAQAMLGHSPTATMRETLVLLGDPGWQRSSSPPELASLLALLETELAEGALGIGILMGYAPRSDPAEFSAVTGVAAAAGVPAYVHAREIVETDPTTPIDGAEEIVIAAAKTGAQMHYCHVNSTSRRHLDRVLATIERAGAEGAKVSLESYPYGAGATAIGAAFLAPEVLSARGLRPSSIVVVATGERVADAARLRELRESDPGATCLVEYLDEEDPHDMGFLHRARAFPDSIIASDAMSVITPAGSRDHDAWPLPRGTRTHPRTAGTFTKALRLMVRETGAWSWAEAFRRCSYLPAQVISGVAPGARRKGRLTPGADADIVVLDPHQVRDLATYREPALPAQGVRHLLVGGTFVVRDGELRPDVRPGRAVRGG